MKKFSSLDPIETKNLMGCNKVKLQKMGSMYFENAFYMFITLIRHYTGKR